jgi:hypothetical protein
LAQANRKPDCRDEKADSTNNAEAGTRESTIKVVGTYSADTNSNQKTDGAYGDKYQRGFG